MKTLSLTLLCLALSGCMSAGPDFKAPAAAAPPDWSGWHGGAAALRGAASDAAPAYARLGDSTLAALQRQALQANHDLRTAALRFAQSRVQRDVAASEQGPQVNASAGAGRQRQSEYGSATRMLGIIAPANQAALAKALSEPFDVFHAGFDTSWEIDLWGRVKRSIEAANARADEGEAVLRQVQLSLAVEVARNYYELRAAQRQLQLARADIAAGEELLELVAARSKGGLGNEIDIARQQGLLATQRAAVPGLLEQEALALNRLSLLAGAAPGSLQALLSTGHAADSAAAFGSTPDLGLGIPADVVARRPDIRAAEAQLHAATAGIGIARADLYPRLTLGVSLGTEALGGGKFGDWGSRQWSIGPSLSLPLFDGGRRRATVQLRELQQQEAAVHYQKTVLGAWHEVDNALSAYAAEQLRRAQWQAREDSSRSALELSEARYRKGLTDALPVLDARRHLLQAQRDRIQSEAALTQRLLAICKAIGVAPLA